MVDTEVKLNQMGLRRYLKLDNKKIIDIVGIGLKYYPWNSHRKIQDQLYDDFQLETPSIYNIGYNILRGIEVKVSKNDFKNGFICYGTNYNYVLTPMKLISPSLLPKGVGLIEYNKYKFDVSQNDTEKLPLVKPFNIKGLRVVKRANYRKLPQFHIDHVISMIGQRRNNFKNETFREVLKGFTNTELVYNLTV
jgi:hypothetical protein